MGAMLTVVLGVVRLAATPAAPPDVDHLLGQSYLPTRDDLLKFAVAVPIAIVYYFAARLTRSLARQELVTVKADPQVILLVIRFTLLARHLIGYIAGF